MCTHATHMKLYSRKLSFSSRSHAPIGPFPFSVFNSLISIKKITRNLFFLYIFILSQCAFYNILSCVMSNKISPYHI